jgi:hypothetical protein
MKKICKDKNITDEKRYYEKCKKYNLPEMPEEITYYGLSNLLTLFNSKEKMIR